MSWNYRIVDFTTEDEPCVGICEVYYDSEGTPCDRTEPMFVADNSDDLLEVISMILGSFSKSILKDCLNEEGEVVMLRALRSVSFQPTMQPGYPNSMTCRYCGTIDGHDPLCEVGVLLDPLRPGSTPDTRGPTRP